MTTPRLTAANAAWRDYEIDGVEASGAHEPAKSDIRSVMALFDASLIALEGVTLPAIAQGTGIDPTGVADSTAALNALFAAYKLIYIPPGIFKVTDALVIPDGVRVVGAGRLATVIYVDTDFNMQAAGVFDLGSTAKREGQSLIDVTIRFYQNEFATSRSQVITYPPAVNFSYSTRADFIRVRTERAFIGFYAVNNFGGTKISRCEIGALAQYSYKKFTGQIAGNVLTVSSGDTPVVGQMIYSVAIGGDAGVTVTGGTYIVSQTDATHFVVSKSQNSASGSMYQSCGGVVLDGARDFLEIEYEAWPYGFDISTPGTLYSTVYNDGTNCGGTIGRVDGLRSSTIASFNNSLVFTQNAAAAGIDKQFDSISLDTDWAQLINYGAPLVIETLYGSSSSSPTIDTVICSGPTSKTRITHAYMGGNSTKGRQFYVTNGATLEVNGGASLRGGVGNDRVAEVDDATSTGARMAFRNFRVVSLPTAGTLSHSIFKQSGNCSMELVNVDFQGNGTAVGTAIEYGADHTDNQVVDCGLNGWGHSLGFTPALGVYDLPAAALLAPPAGNRSILENGMMDSWNGPTSVSIANAATAVVADRFKIVNNNTTATGTAQRQAAPAGFLGKYAMQWTVTGAASGSVVDFEQRFESSEGMRLDGQAVAFSFDLVGTTSAGALTVSVILQCNSTTDANDFSTTLSTITGVTISGTGGRKTVIIPAASTVGIAKGGRIRVRITQTTSVGTQDVSTGAWQLERAILSAGTLCASAMEIVPRVVSAEAGRRRRRYYAPAVAFSNIANGQAISTTQAHVVLPLDQPMSAVPSLSISAAGDFYLLAGGSSNVAVTAMSIATASTPQSITLVVTVASGLTAGQEIILRTANTSATLALSSEL